MRFREGLSDRQAADAVRGRIDWKCLLALELADAGFDHSVPCGFRGRPPHRPTGETRRQVEAMAALFLSQERMGAILGVSNDTLPALGAVLFWLAMPETRGAPAMATAGGAETKSVA